MVTMRFSIIVLLVLAPVLGFVPGTPLARAADATYPPGSRIGLVPPPGVTTSANFFGFEDRDNGVAIITVALPVEAYVDLENSVSAEGLKRQGITLEGKEPVPLPGGKAFLVIGRQDIDNTKVRKWILVASAPQLTALVTAQIPDTARERYPDAAIRAALATVAVRTTVPTEEQLSLLPFTVAELAGFKVGGVVPGRAVMLSDAAPDVSTAAAGALDPHIFVAVAPGGPGQNSERDAFARDVFATIPGIKEVRVTSAEPLRVAGQQGYQIMAEAKDPSGLRSVTVVQWLRFGGSGYVQMVGIARTDAWKDAYPRFRSVRDGIEPK
jgi:hypothetical protein